MRKKRAHKGGKKKSLPKVNPIEERPVTAWLKALARGDRSHNGQLADYYRPIVAEKVVARIKQVFADLKVHFDDQVIVAVVIKSFLSDLHHGRRTFQHRTDLNALLETFVRNKVVDVRRRLGASLGSTRPIDEEITVTTQVPPTVFDSVAVADYAEELADALLAVALEGKDSARVAVRMLALISDLSATAMADILRTQFPSFSPISAATIRNEVASAQESLLRRLRFRESEG